MQLQGIVSNTISDNSPLVDKLAYEGGPDATLDSGVTDVGNTPTYWIREGLVCVKKTSTGTFVGADDATGDRNAAASVTSLADIGAGAASKTFKYKMRGGAEQTITTGGGDNTIDLVVTALNADAVFKTYLKASKTGSKLVVTCLYAGPEDGFEITDGTINGQGGVAHDTFAASTPANTTVVPYFVTLDLVSLQLQGTAVKATVPTARRGHFLLSRLRSLTAEARANLAAAGSIFE